jgi:hypothetical protein
MSLALGEEFSIACVSLRAPLPGGYFLDRLRLGFLKNAFVFQKTVDTRTNVSFAHCSNSPSNDTVLFNVQRGGDCQTESATDGTIGGERPGAITRNCGRTAQPLSAIN